MLASTDRLTRTLVLAARTGGTLAPGTQGTYPLPNLTLTFMNSSKDWVFCGTKAAFPSAVFQTKEDAESWIQVNRLNGTLTQYPVGISVYDWAVQEGLFKPKKEEHSLPSFIQSFSSASQEHYHYEDGRQ